MEVVRGALSHPEDVALMRTVLEEAATILPAHRRTPARKRSSRLASWLPPLKASAIQYS